MNKSSFISKLKKNLKILDENEVKDIVDEYSETIDEKIKNGKTEEEAIKDFGDVNELCKEILKAYKINPKFTDDDIILIHDAVRPFITNKIIKDSIEGARKYGATVATIPAVDTIVASKDGEVVSHIPDRNELFYGQSPDTFRLKEFIEMSNITWF